MSAEYQCQPLQGASKFRLLHILPGQLDSRLRCHLQRVSFYSKMKRPRYTAMSYTWSDDKEMLEILCHGLAKFITKKLHMRSRFVNRIVCADQICINQRSDNEKSHQKETSEVKQILRLSWAHEKELGGLLQQKSDDYFTGKARFGL
jgi:hypothetical protein